MYMLDMPFQILKKRREQIMVKESKFQSDLIKELKKRFEGCIVIKIDPTFIQGFPDLLILYKAKWAALECKKTAKASKRPNQSYWVKLLNKLSFASFIYPENKNQVLNKLTSFFNKKEVLDYAV